MATPISGRGAVIGVKKGATWRTPVLVGAGEGLAPKTFTLRPQMEILSDEPLGTGFSTSTDSGKINTAGDITGEIRYGGLEWLLVALAMGAAGTPTQIGATLAYRHTLQLTADIPGLFATMVRKMKSDEVYEFPSVKPMGLTLRGGVRIPTEYTIPLLGDRLNQNIGSGTNHNGTIGSVTVPDNRNRVIGDENAYVRINDQAAGALGPSENIYISEFELGFTRPQEGDWVTDQNAAITEPVGTGFPETSLRLTFPQHGDQDAAILAAFGTNPLVPKKLEIFLRGGIANGSENYRLLIQCPQVFVVGDPPGISGPGKIPTEIMLRLTQATAAPTGMTSPAVTNPFAMLLVNLKNSNYLA